jgi:hypothetical protein
MVCFTFLLQDYLTIDDGKGVAALTLTCLMVIDHS